MTVSKPDLKARLQCLQLKSPKCDEPLSNFAFDFNLRRYSEAEPRGATSAEASRLVTHATEQTDVPTGTTPAPHSGESTRMFCPHSPTAHPPTWIDRCAHKINQHNVFPRHQPAHFIPSSTTSTYALHTLVPRVKYKMASAHKVQLCNKLNECYECTLILLRRLDGGAHARGRAGQVVSIKT